MTECKFIKNEICCHAGCEFFGDFCPFYKRFGTCICSSINDEKTLAFIDLLEDVWRKEVEDHPEYAAGVQFAMVEFIKRFR